MPRREFSAKIMDAAEKRAAGQCQKCEGTLRPGKFHFDHILPDALGGKPELANCQVLCEACHVAKTHDEDRPRINKADKQRRAHIGAKVAPAQPIKSAGFPKKPPRDPKPMPPRRSLYA